MRNYSIRSMYAKLRKRFLQVARDAQRAAFDREAELALIYPEWKPKEGEGPVEKWERDFAQSGYITTQKGRMACRLPENIEQVAGSWSAKTSDTTRVRLITRESRPHDRPVKS